MLKSRNNSIGEDDLFLQLGIKSGGLPDDVCRNVYYGLVKVIVEQFRSGKDIILPGLGKMYMVEKKPSRGLDVSKGEVVMRPGHREIVWNTADSLKKYINTMEVHFPN